MWKIFQCHHFNSSWFSYLYSCSTSVLKQFKWIQFCGPQEAAIGVLLQRSLRRGEEWKKTKKHVIFLCYPLKMTHFWGRTRGWICLHFLFFQCVTSWAMEDQPWEPKPKQVLVFTPCTWPVCVCALVCPFASIWVWYHGLSDLVPLRGRRTQCPHGPRVSSICPLALWCSLCCVVPRAARDAFLNLSSITVQVCIRNRFYKSSKI